MKRLYLTIDDKLAKRKSAVCKQHKLTWLDVIELGVEAAESAVKEGREKVINSIEGNESQKKQKEIKMLLYCSKCKWVHGKDTMTGIGSAWPCDSCMTSKFEPQEG